MVTRYIEIDEETDRMLSELAEDYQGDLGQALSELVHARGELGSLADDSEAAERENLQAQRERAERGFREGRFTRWEDVKRQNGL